MLKKSTLIQSAQIYHKVSPPDLRSMLDLARRQKFRSSDLIKEILESIGFIDIIYDKARIFPTIVAHKST